MERDLIATLDPALHLAIADAQGKSGVWIEAVTVGGKARIGQFDAGGCQWTRILGVSQRLQFALARGQFERVLDHGIVRSLYRLEAAIPQRLSDCRIGEGSAVYQPFGKLFRALLPEQKLGVEIVHAEIFTRLG